MTVSFTPTPKQLLASSAPHMGMPHPVATRHGRLRFRFWYDAIIDWMLLNPDKTLKQCAEFLGRKPDTIYSITSSDIFKARLAQRRQDYNDRLAAGISEAAGNVAMSSLQEIHRRVRDNAAAIPTVVLNDIANKALDRLGYGSRRHPSDPLADRRRIPRPSSSEPAR